MTQDTNGKVASSHLDITNESQAVSPFPAANKSQGSYGKTTGIFKILRNDLKSFYVKYFNYSFENGSLTNLQKQDIISLLPKKIPMCED